MLADLGSVSGASYVIADHYIFTIFVAVALHERPGSLRNLWFLSFRHFVFIFEIVKPAGMSSRTRGRIGQTKWRKEIHSKQHKFQGFPEISQSFIYTYSHSNEKNDNVECQWYKLRPRLNSSLLHFSSATLEILTRVIYCRGQEVSELNLYFCFFFLLNLILGWSVEGSVGVVHGPVHR